MGYGDRLAGGGRSATFPAAPAISQEKWDAIWETSDGDIEVFRIKDDGKTFKKVTENGKQLQRKSSANHR